MASALYSFVVFVKLTQRYVHANLLVKCSLYIPANLRFCVVILVREINKYYNESRRRECPTNKEKKEGYLD
jgi:hypothetical protein